MIITRTYLPNKQEHKVKKDACPLNGVKNVFFL